MALTKFETQLINLHNKANQDNWTDIYCLKSNPKPTYAIINPDDGNYSLGNEDLEQEDPKIWDYQIGTAIFKNQIIPVFEY